MITVFDQRGCRGFKPAETQQDVSSLVKSSQQTFKQSEYFENIVQCKKWLGIVEVGAGKVNAGIVMHFYLNGRDLSVWSDLEIHKPINSSRCGI